MNSVYTRTVSAPKRAMSSSGDTVLPRDFDIFSILPVAGFSFVIIPWLKSRAKGSSTSTSSRSFRTRQTKRAYRRWRIACSIPPTYWSTGIHFAARSGSTIRPASSGFKNRR